jgi:mRNA interferase YafQ
MRGIYSKSLQSDLAILTALLEADAVLPERYRDHPLSGELRDLRDCHLRPDLLVLYRKPDAVTLELVRLASHSELGF